MSIFLLACILAICLPILSVQIPRYFSFSNPRSNNPTAEGPSLHQRAPSIRLRRRLRSQSRADTTGQERKATDSADSGTGSEEVQVQPTPSKTTQRPPLDMIEPKGKERERKPWDPPFPKREAVKNMEMKGDWFVIPPTPPRKTGRDMEKSGIARRLFPLSVDGDGESTDQQDEHVEDARQMEPLLRDSAGPGSSKPKTVANKVRSSTTSIPWLSVAVLAIAIFIFMFAILVAHCLAWFLVYKTEARLGEARKGIMQGGDMRLCLCAT